jgi:hypothetical protein
VTVSQLRPRSEKFDEDDVVVVVVVVVVISSILVGVT